VAENDGGGEGAVPELTVAADQVGNEGSSKKKNLLFFTTLLRITQKIDLAEKLVHPEYFLSF